MKLSGLGVEYRVLSVYSRDAGQREAKLTFDVGQGTQDLGFRSEIDILFTADKASTVTLHVFDESDKPTTACFVIRDSANRVYPSQAKRLAPDFPFHPQVYRADGETVMLPPGEYHVEITRGPEYLVEHRKITTVDGGQAERGGVSPETAGSIRSSSAGIPATITFTPPAALTMSNRPKASSHPT